MQRDHQEKLESKLKNLEGKLNETSKQHESSITRLQEAFESGNNQHETTLSQIQSDLKLTWLQKVGSELKDMVCQIFEMNGTTLSAVQRIEERLHSRADMTLSRTFILEDPLGRTTQIDMVYVSSWDAFDSVLEVCFRDLPGHGKVAKKDYILQDQKTNREMQRSVPWLGAFKPGQHVNMGLIFRQRRGRTRISTCPACLQPLKESQPESISPW